MIKKVILFVACIISLVSISNVSLATDAIKTSSDATPNIESKSAILMVGDTGEILYEKESTQRMAPASITKIMTLLLIFDAIEDGKISLEDEVTVSEHAASMGGSQVYLEVNETQTVHDMIKCISIASANDACVAMAEYIAGTEEQFVKMMNDKAAGLNMENTHFVNCCGLDVDNHYSCAYDIAIMGRELVTRYPQISDYATTWMDTIIHKTKKGEKEFGLTNTNKLVRTYDGITGLKTGSTDDAGYCLCATSSRNDIEMVAVVMSAKDHKARYQECAKLMDYGHGICSMYVDENNYEDILENIPVKKSIEECLKGEKTPFSYVITNQNDKERISTEIVIQDLEAPVCVGDKVGYIEYFMGDKSIGKVDILSKENIPKAKYSDYLVKVFKEIFVI